MSGLGDRYGPLLHLVVFASVLGLSLSALTLAPAMQEVVRYVNESYIVTCADMDGGAVSWWKEQGSGVRLGSSGHPLVTGMGAATALVFERVNTGDRGQYTCKSTEPDHLTATFTLTVISPITFEDTPPVQIAREHRPYTVRCRVSGDPNPKVLWKFEGHEPTAKRYQVTNDGLHIDNVTLSDRGQYTCRAYQVSPVTSMYEEKTITLNVQHKPVHRKPVHAKVNEAWGFIGGEVNLSCEAVAEPAANFTWLRQNPSAGRQPLPGRLVVRAHSSTLQLFVVNASVFGDYKCQASNAFGTLNQIISLQEGVQPPPPRGLGVTTDTSDSLEVKVLPPSEEDTAHLTKNMLPTGFRLSYRKLEDAWSDADFQPRTENDTYVLTALSHNTRYEVRAATWNLAGLSNYTSSIIHKTRRLQADSPGDSGAATTAAAAVVVVAALLAALC